MAKEKVTLTLDAELVDEIRRLAGARSLSAAVDRALFDYVAKLRHLASVDEWLAEMEREHGPIPSETLDWAASIVDAWATGEPSKASSGAARRRAS
jgi:predicted transcriptional regulator